MIYLIRPFELDETICARPFGEQPPILAICGKDRTASSLTSGRAGVLGRLSSC